MAAPQFGVNILTAAGDGADPVRDAQRAEELYQRCTEEQLEFLLKFFAQGREFNDRQAAALEAELAQRQRERSGA